MTPKRPPADVAASIRSRLLNLARARNIVREDIRFDGKYAGVRVKLTWSLAGARIPMQIDVAFGGSIVPPPQTESYPTLLDHPSPQILAYPRETVVAEKLEAILTLGPTNTRMKDFYDLRLLALNFDFEARRLLAALRATFENRGTPLPEPEPEEFTRDYLMDPERSALWRSFWRRSRPTDPPESVEAMADALQRFLWPVCRALAGVAELPDRWSAGGPWR